MTPTPSSITRSAKSNLAIALRLLPRATRRDTEVYYAYCRVIDDIADDTRTPADKRKALLDAWENAILSGDPGASRDPLQAAVIDLFRRHAIAPDLATALIAGCRDDLPVRHFSDFPALQSYIWQVAGSVGVISAKLFGCTSPGARAYAEALGTALQLTNILRDIGEDAACGRLYLPLDVIARHGLVADDMAPAIEGDPRFIALMDELAQLARSSFASAAELHPAQDARPLAPARAMAHIYQSILARMCRDRFHVFSRRYRLPATHKAAILLRQMLLPGA